MELSNVQIAKLVLGYLKLEKCHSLYNDFLNASPYLKEFNNPKKRKYIVTRVLGQSLVDILKDYAIIYTIIQERLEETNFYNEGSTTNKLSKQLVYLLDGCNPSRTGSPISNCPSSTPYANSPVQANTLTDFTPDVNTTLLDSLPGNSDTTPKRKTPLPASRSHRLNTNDLDRSKSTDKSAEDTATSPEGEEEVHIEKAIEAFAQTLLEHHELQEKIARNINSVRHSDGEINEADSNEKNDDIDKAIKAVLEKTESDPAFENLIGEIIGTVTETREAVQSQSQPFNVLCEIPAEQKDPNQATLCQKTELNQKLSVNTNTGDITIYHGTMENYVTSDSLKALTPQPIMLNPSNLLLMTTNQNQSYTPTTSIDPTKPLLLNNQIILSTPQPQSFIVNKFLTEQDIMAMPTVIVTEETPKQKPKEKPKEKMKEKQKTKKIIDRKLRNIVPKCNKPDNIADYLMFYKPTDDETQKKKQETALVQMVVTEDHSENMSLAEPITEVMNSESTNQDESKSLTAKENENVDLMSQGKSKSLDKGAVGVTKTTPDNKGRKRSVSTPRSGNRSHVRALDFKFETPAKEKCMVKKAGTSPKIVRKSPVKTLSKSVKNLFTSPVKSPLKKRRVELRKAARKGNSWDADLRALASSSEVSTKLTQKKKSAKKKVVKEDLNKTEDDALMIEAAILENSPEDNAPARRARSKSVRSVKSEEVLVEEKEEDCPNSVEHVTLRNCNTKAKYKKKCNIDSNTKKELKVTAVREIKNLENPGEKLVMSPSGLNANKRNLVEIDEKKLCGEKKEAIVESLEDILPSTKLPTEKAAVVYLERVDVEVKKFLTPEMAKIPPQIPSTSKKNIIPMLETPIKDITPKTPGFFSPVNTNDTPFTKVFKEQLQGVDLSSIPTPKFPLTPNFPFTPLIESQSPYTNRPTDYSTSSSYYQPSDTEQNKSLELLIIEECKRLENKKTPGKEDTVQNPAIETQSDLLEQMKEDSTHRVIADKMKAMSSNIIARKNLSLVKRKNASSEESSSSGSETDSSDDESSSSDEGNDTVVQKGSRDNSVTRYALRSKNKIEDNKKIEENKIIKECNEEEVERKVDEKSLEKELGRIVGEVPEEEKVIEIGDEQTNEVEASKKIDIKTSEKSIKIIEKMCEKKGRVSCKTPRGTSKGGARIEKIVQDIEKKVETIGNLKKIGNTLNNVSSEGMVVKKRNAKAIAKVENVEKVVGEMDVEKGNENLQIDRVDEDMDIDPVDEDMDEEKESNLDKEDLDKDPLKKSDNFIKSIIENTSFKPQLKKPASKTLPSYQEKVLREMEEKRKRTIEMFKRETKLETEADKTKPKKVKITTSVPKKRNLRSTSKAGKAEDNEIQPFQVVETEFSELETDEQVVIKEADEKISDSDAEILVKGLKQWGIHLVHNKSPKMPKSSKEDKSENLDEINARKSTKEVVEEKNPKKIDRNFEEKVHAETNVVAKELAKWGITLFPTKSTKVGNNSKVGLDKVKEINDVEEESPKATSLKDTKRIEVQGCVRGVAKAVNESKRVSLVNAQIVKQAEIKDFKGERPKGTKLKNVRSVEIEIQGRSSEISSVPNKSSKIVDNSDDLEEGEIVEEEKGNKIHGERIESLKMLGTNFDQKTLKSGKKSIKIDLEEIKPVQGYQKHIKNFDEGIQGGSSVKKLGINSVNKCQEVVNKSVDGKVGEEGSKGKSRKIVRSFEDEIRGVKGKSQKSLLGGESKVQGKTPKVKIEKVLLDEDESQILKGKSSKASVKVESKSPKSNRKVVQKRGTAKKKVEDVGKKITKSAGENMRKLSKSDSIISLKAVSNVKNDGVKEVSENLMKTVKIDDLGTKLIVTDQVLTDQKEKSNNLTGNVKEKTNVKIENLGNSTKELPSDKNDSSKETLSEKKQNLTLNDGLKGVGRDLLSLEKECQNAYLILGDLIDQNATKINDNVEIIKGQTLSKDYDCKTDSLTVTETANSSGIGLKITSLPTVGKSISLEMDISADTTKFDEPVGRAIGEKTVTLTTEEKADSLTLNTGAIETDHNIIKSIDVTDDNLIVSDAMSSTVPNNTNNPCSTVPIDSCSTVPNANLSVPNSVDHQLSSVDVYDIPLDTKSWINTDSPDLVLTHDENHVAKTDYDLALNDKAVAITVYIERLDLEVDKRLTVSPFHSALDHRPVNILIPKRKSTNNKNSRPLNALYTELVGEDSLSGSSIQGSQISPLDELYDSQKSFYGSSGVKKGKKVEFKRNRRREDAVRRSSIKEEEDIRSISTNKRKAEDLEGEAKKAKTVNCQELLKTVNVDDFLKRVHGEKEN